MVYEYPPSRFAENLTLTIVFHAILLAAALVPLFFVWLRTKTPARKSEIWFIAAAMMFVPLCLLGVASSLPWHWVQFLLLYIAFFEIVAVVSLVVISRRLRIQGQATSVVGIVGSLFGLGFLIMCLLPSTPSAREAAKRMQCSNNLKQIMLCLLDDEVARGAYLPVTSSIENGPAVSWRIEVLPYLENQALFDAYDRKAVWDSNSNSRFSKTRIQSYVCPSNLTPTDEQGRYFTAYVRPAGTNVKTAAGGRLDLSRSNTLAVIEACGLNIVWSEPKDSIVDDSTVGVNLPGKTLGTSDGAISSYHTGGANAAMLDGSVRFFSEQVDPSVLKRMLDGLRSDETNVFFGDQ